MINNKSGRWSESPETRRKWNSLGKETSPKAPLDKFIASARERCVRIRSVHSDGKVTTGTGVIIETGIVVTNWHLIEDPTIIKTTINDHDAEMVHFYFHFDLIALVGKTRKLRRIKMQKKLPFQTQRVFYVGNPEDWNKTVSEGTVVKVTETKIRSSNCPAVGFSGSGLYASETGELVGIIDSMEGSLHNGCNFAVAVPIPIVNNFLADVSFKMRKRRHASLTATQEQRTETKVPSPCKLDF